MIISFSGTSGSGKSTIITEIKKSGIFAGKKIILREEDSFVTIKLLKLILGDNVFSKYKEEKFFKKRYNDVLYKIFSTLSYIFYPLVVYIEFLSEYIFYQLIFKDRILIADRFTYDYAVTFKNVLGINNKFVEWLYNHSPKPYLAFLVDINLSTALKRNKNNIPGKITAEESFHKNVLNHYNKIAKRENLIVVDNNGNIEDSIEYVSSQIINKRKLLRAKKIVLSGLDGTGKTTTAILLSKYVNSLDIRCTIVHFYHVNLLFKLLRLIGFYKTDKQQNIMYRKRRERSAKERQQSTPFIMALLRFFDSYIQYLYYIIINGNKLIIFDRYFYDYLASFEYLNIKWHKMFSKIIPSVSEKFLFVSSPLISYNRKPESVREFFIESHEIYFKVAKEQNLKIINTENKKPEDVLKELLEKIN